MSRRVVGRVAQTALVVLSAGFFALLGLGLVMALTDFGTGVAQCVPGAKSVHGFTPIVGGGGVMASWLCARDAAAAALWPWPVVSVVAGALFGAVFALGLIHLFRTGIRRLSRWHRPPSRDLWLSSGV